MKRLTYHYTYPSLLAALIVTLCATLAFADTRPSHLDRAEVRIKELHTTLKITKTQEDLWRHVTEVMRKNARTMDTLNKARFEKSKSMTAIEDLTSYAALATAHAEGLQKFVPVFETLYVSMSETQKHNADTVFRHHSDMKAQGKGKAKGN